MSMFQPTSFVARRTFLTALADRQRELILVDDDSIWRFRMSVILT
jgi:hypothetical protein